MNEQEELAEIVFGACPDEMHDGTARRIGVNAARAILAAGYRKTVADAEELGADGD